ncbi:hypothetical protein SPHINGO8AM_50019 [Sphingomonas sp. 8AM]|nr:hypothetical protein SPHINGO8AM_50019 [Sphingomonas sp. 8AM]
MAGACGVRSGLWRTPAEARGAAPFAGPARRADPARRGEGRRARPCRRGRRQTGAFGRLTGVKASLVIPDFIRDPASY